MGFKRVLSSAGSFGKFSEEMLGIVGGAASSCMFCSSVSGKIHVCTEAATMKAGCKSE